VIGPIVLLQSVACTLISVYGANLIVAYPRRLKAAEKGVAKTLVPPLPKPAVIRRAYVMSKKEASNSGTVVIDILF